MSLSVSEYKKNYEHGFFKDFSNVCYYIWFMGTNYIFNTAEYERGLKLTKEFTAK